MTPWERFMEDRYNRDSAESLCGALAIFTAQVICARDAPPSRREGLVTGILPLDIWQEALRRLEENTESTEKGARRG